MEKKGEELLTITREKEREREDRKDERKRNRSEMSTIFKR